MSTKASGKTIWQKEKECCVLKMVQYTPAISLKEKNGAGVLVTKNGTRFEGNFKNGLKDGDFLEKDATGKLIRKCVYRSGRLLSEQK